MQIVRKRTVWWPTAWGWLVLIALVSAPFVLWWFCGEAFFTVTDRVPATVLVVEGWAGRNAPGAVANEFRRGAYHYVVVTGGWTGEPWSPRRWNSVDETAEALRQLGLPPSELIAAATGDTEGHRTFEMAVNAWRALRARNIHPSAINVFTLGVHARRSRLVFAKVFGAQTKFGVVAWIPPGFYAGPWWRSSERAEDLIKETVAYPFELLLNSGRLSNSPAAPGASSASAGIH